MPEKYEMKKGKINGEEGTFLSGKHRKVKGRALRAMLDPKKYKMVEQKKHE